jgi:hypothetical protein
LLQALLLDTVAAVRASGLPFVVGVDPADSVDEVRELVPDAVGVMGQSAGDLGERMRSLMAQVLDGGAPAALVVGSDLPDLSAAALGSAAAVLAANPDALVVGPSADGGYYLVGATRVPEVFHGIAWGTNAVLAQTRAAAIRVGFGWHTVERGSDVDGVADLLAVHAPRTRAWVDANLRGRASVEASD